MLEGIYGKLHLMMNPLSMRYSTHVKIIMIICQHFKTEDLGTIFCLNHVSIVPKIKIIIISFTRVYTTQILWLSISRIHFQLRLNFITIWLFQFRFDHLRNNHNSMHTILKRKMPTEVFIWKMSKAFSVSNMGVYYHFRLWNRRVT